MTSTKKKSVNEDFDYVFTPKKGLPISSPITSSRRRSPRVKTITAIYGADDSTSSSEHELNSRGNRSCSSYWIKAESLESVDGPFSCDNMYNTKKRCSKKRKASNSVMLDHDLVSPKEEEVDLDEPLISLKVMKGKKHRKLFKSTEGSSVDKVWVSNGASSQKTNNMTESEDENVEAVSGKNIFDSGMSESTYTLNSEIVEKCDDVDCNMEMNPMADIPTSISEIKSNVTVINSVESNDAHDVSASDQYIDPSEDYGSSDKMNVAFEGVLDNRDDTAVLIHPQDSCVDEVEPIEIDSQMTCIVQRNEEHSDNGRSIDTSDTCDQVPPSYSESNTWTSSTNDLQLFIGEGNYDAIVHDNQKSCVNEFNSINNCTEFRLGDKGEKKIVQETCNFGNASAYKNVGSLDSLVFQALCGDAHMNNQESQIEITVEDNTSGESYNSSHPKHSGTLLSLPSDLHSTTNISLLENSVSYSAKIQTLNNVDERISNAANNIQSSTEMKLNLVEREKLNNENELKCSQEANNEDQNYPKNLLQNRKDLSPISQEKLCWYDDELDDTIKALGHVTDSIQSPEITRKRLKRNRSLSHRSLSKENMNLKDGSDGNSSCVQTSINTQSQKAVLFSQRQMQDIENIATKLLKEMSSLKNIVADITNTDNVGSEACLFSYSKFTPEEITAAIGSASNLEATTKKWLAMMSKDCNRFCKIMSSTEHNVSTSGVIASKQSRKVSFADEAGGSLCHVKVFEQLSTDDIQVEPKNDYIADKEQSLTSI